MKALPLLVFSAGFAFAQASFPGAAAIDTEVQNAIANEQIPGAVVEIGHNGAVVFRQAYGSRALVPKREQMSVDTIFDVASLTKVIATTSCLMKLYDEGKLQIDAPVNKYLPEFQGGQSPLTVRNLMTHFSGLRPDLDLSPKWSGYETGIAKAMIEKSTTPPGTRFVYSDINFILLGEIVHRLSGKTLDKFARDAVFEPLGMKHTRFNPLAEWGSRIAPTELDAASNLPIRGVVHDETARFMGGVAGHAGVFSTADDLGRFAQMMIDGGLYEGKRVFAAATIREFTRSQSPLDQPIRRGLGWDIDSPYSRNRGDRFPVGSFGHTGFTGTSIWIDPASKTYVIILANSVHPHRGRSLTALRSHIATIAAESVGLGPAPKPKAPPSKVRTGLDVLVNQKFASLLGRRVGLITNHTGRTADGLRNVDVMVAAGVKVVAIFTPEHGLLGREDQPNVSDTKDTATGLPVYSLFNGPKQRLTPEMMRGIDALVYDIQDVGARFYTYSCTLISSIEEAGKQHIPIYVLDRPNPVTGSRVEGPVLDKDLESFVGCFEMPVRHGMTFGELATMANAERKYGADLRIVEMEGWHRADWWDATGLEWIDPSPNMRSLNAATLYTGVAMMEYSRNLSVGRGTDAPFEQLGADWMNGRAMADFLNERGMPGIRVYPVRFRPTSSNFQGKTIPGVRFVITDRETFSSVRLGLEIGCAMEKLYPGKIAWDTNRSLIGSHEVITALKSGADPKTILEKMQPALLGFLQRRQHYLLYQ